MRRSTSLTLDAALLAEARRLGVNVSRAAEAGVGEAVRAAQAEAWRAENAEAIADYNAGIAAGTLPLARHRKF